VEILFFQLSFFFPCSILIIRKSNDTTKKSPKRESEFFSFSYSFIPEINFSRLMNIIIFSTHTQYTTRLWDFFQEFLLKFHLNLIETIGTFKSNHTNHAPNGNDVTFHRKIEIFSFVFLFFHTFSCIFFRCIYRDVHSTYKNNDILVTF
jgi:hypothetical protein